MRVTFATNDAQAQADAATILGDAESGTYLNSSDLPSPATAPQISYLGRIDAVRPDDYNAQWQFGTPTEATSASVGIYDPWYWYGDNYGYNYGYYYGGYGQYSYGSSSASTGYFWGDYDWYSPNHTQDDLIRPTDAAGEAGVASTYAWWNVQQVGGVQVFGGGSAVGDSALDTFATQADWGYSWYYGDYGYYWTNDVLPGVGSVVDTTTMGSLSAVSVTSQIYGLGRDSATLVGFQASALDYRVSASASADSSTPFGDSDSGGDTDFSGASGDDADAAGVGGASAELASLRSPMPQDGSGLDTFDGQGNLTSLTDDNGGITQFGYDASGDLTNLTDADGNSTTWSYNSQNQVKQETDAQGESDSFTYNTSGQLASYTDKDGNVRTYQYDTAGHVTTETLYATTADADAGQNAEDTLHYAYDSSGNMVSESDDSSSDTYTYDSQNRLTSVSETSVDAPTVVLTYQYSGTSTQPSGVTATIDGVADYQDAYKLQQPRATDTDRPHRAPSSGGRRP